MLKKIQEKEKQLKSLGYLQFSDEELKKLSLKDADAIVLHFHGHALMVLPESEVAFFEWLKENDRLVWNDLWGEDDEPYRISVDFLPNFLKDGNGFPICDLIDVDNYWFSDRHIKPKGWHHFEQIRVKMHGKEKLTIGELLMVEVANGAIDLWHFCYRYNIPVSIAKEHLDNLIHEDFIVHLSDREDLVKYLDI
jgi:hypothetical protein